MESLEEKMSSTTLAEPGPSDKRQEPLWSHENLAEIKARIVKKDLKLPKDFKGKLAFVLHNVFTKEECEDYIRKTEEMGYEEALVNVGYGQLKMKDVRNNDRCIWDSVEEADRIWHRIVDYIPKQWSNYSVVGLNERLRFLRYRKGEYFKPHMDGMYTRTNGERSLITIQLYLNEGFKGGSTTFMNNDCSHPVECVPKTGMVLVFEHRIMHEGSELKKGVKYSMRTDIMYKWNPVQSEPSSDGSSSQYT